MVCRSLFFQPATPLACKDNQSLNNRICLEALHVSRELLKLHLITVCVCGGVVYHNVMHMCRPEDNPVKLVLSFSPYVGPGSRTQVTRRSCKYFNLLSQLAGPTALLIYSLNC